MKTAISVPDELAARVDRTAGERGMSRSELYATAARRYLDELDGEGLLARMNAAIDADPGQHDQREWARGAGRALGLRADDRDDW